MSAMTEPTGADLSRLVVLVPLAGLEEAKTRLGATLDAEERQALVLGLLDRTVRAADRVETVAAVVVVSPDPAVLRAATAAGATPVRQSDVGLNEGLRAATRWARGRRARPRSSSWPATCRGVTPDAVRSLIAAAARGRWRAATRRDRRRPARARARTPSSSARPTRSGSPSARGAGPRTVPPPMRPAPPSSSRTGRSRSTSTLPEDLILAEELGLLDPARVG